jgi:Uma2 family endonuclease
LRAEPALGEILSPSTRRHDVLIKKPYYARVGVSHHCLIDRAARTLTAYRLEAGRWLELGVYGDEREARIEPFEAVPLDVLSFWS